MRRQGVLRNGKHYQLRDTDGTPITEQQGRQIVADRYTIPDDVRAARRQLTATARTRRRNERTQ